jgi:hypothetical protein
LLASALCLSEGGSPLPLILINDFDDFDDRKLPVASFAKAVAGCQADCPLQASFQLRCSGIPLYSIASTSAFQSRSPVV